MNLTERFDTVRISYKRTRRGKVRKLVRPVYFRDDLVCGVTGCSLCSEKDQNFQETSLNASQRILVVDCDTAIAQTDFLLADECVDNCVLCYTTLDAAKRANRTRGDKLWSLCRPIVEDVPTITRKRFFALPNDFLSETFVPFSLVDPAGGAREWKAVLEVSKWYVRHLSLPSDRVLLLTSSEVYRDEARASGVSAMTVWEYVDSVRDVFPSAGENLAAPSGIGETGEEDVYLPHISSPDIATGIRDGLLRHGVLRMAIGTCNRATVGDVEIVGKRDLNRAVDGDIVAVEVIDTTSDNPSFDHSSTDPDHGDENNLNNAITESASDVMAERLLMGEVSSDSKTPTSPVYGRVVGIIRRNWKEYSGTLRAESGDDGIRQERMFIPADPRIPFIRIRTKNAAELNGKRIVVVIDSWDRCSRSPSGHWVAILGAVGDRVTESDVILREHQVITRPFSKEVMSCLPPADFKPDSDEIAKRLDLRSIPVCSIDPPGCKDIDDALSCQRLHNGNFRVGVHIADVTHFVHPGSAIDREAAERCTTVYLVEKRTDMLPGLLTADLCSLRSRVDRLCFSVIWEMEPTGEIIHTEFHKAVINSRASLTYAAAQAMIDDPADQSELTESIRNLNVLAKKIRQARMERGALELESQEVRFELDNETQDPIEVTVYQTKDTNRLVEEFMVLANQSVARQILSHFPSTSVLRRHPPPQESHLTALQEVLEKQGFADFKFGTNKELAGSLSKISRSRDPFFNRLVRVMTTRCMNQATYFCTGDIDPGSFWHYGLAMDLYTHFTSPIRRYADVLVHRLLAASLGISKLPDTLQTKTSIHNQCDTMNIKHKLAQLAGRASAELHIYLYFKKIGVQECDTIITKMRMTKRGQIALHVLSPRYGIEGVVTLPVGWSFDHRTETATSTFDAQQLSVFDHVIVRIKADDTHFRLRTIFEYLRPSDEADVLAAVADTDRKRIDREIFPDRIQNEGPRI